MYTMPLSRFSAASEQANVRCGILLFEIEGHANDAGHDRRVATPDHSFWYSIAGNAKGTSGTRTQSRLLEELEEWSSLGMGFSFPSSIMESTTVGGRRGRPPSL